MKKLPPTSRLSNHRGEPSRRAAMQRLVALMAVPTSATLIGACGGGGESAPAPTPPMPPPVPPVPPPPTSSALERVKAALLRVPLGFSGTPLTITQGSANSVASSFGSDVRVYPPLGSLDQSLATIPQVWGHRRDLWTARGGAVIASRVVHPVQRQHPAETQGSDGVCGLHFEFDGSAFEVLVAGIGANFTLLIDGQYAASRVIRTTLSPNDPGASFVTNTFVRFDLGTRAPRRISLYALSTQGPCAIATGPNDSLQPWDRSGEASFATMADSYGGGSGPKWIGGPFWEAAALLGMPHPDLDHIGGTGYARNGGSDHARLAGNAFLARLATNVNARPDLFLTAGGINDNNSVAMFPYASAADARAGFVAEVNAYYTELRARLPDSILVAVGPWTPRQSIPTDPIALSKSETIKAALQAVGGLWVFLDNLHGGWVTSAGASAPADSPWQTGTGTVAAPRGDGNGDMYVSRDGTHPNEAGCLYLGTRLATDLRAALLTL